MSIKGISESVLEEAALAWFEGLGYEVAFGTGEALLPKLLSGEIRIKDAEKIVDGAT
jgi:hypothetical protein